MMSISHLTRANDALMFIKTTGKSVAQEFSRIFRSIRVSLVMPVNTYLIRCDKIVKKVFLFYSFNRKTLKSDIGYAIKS